MAQSSLLRVVRQVAVFIVGVAVLIVGVALLVLPGPAFIVIPAGLAILAIEFVWARRWLGALKARAQTAVRWCGMSNGSAPNEGAEAHATASACEASNAEHSGAGTESAVVDGRRGEAKGP